MKIDLFILHETTVSEDQFGDFIIKTDRTSDDRVIFGRALSRLEMGTLLYHIDEVSQLQEEYTEYEYEHLKMICPQFSKILDERFLPCLSDQGMKIFRFYLTVYERAFLNGT